MSRSLLLTLDTKYAKEMATATPASTTVMSSSLPSTTIAEEEPDNANSIDSSSLLGIRITLISSQRLEAALGLMAAVAAFATLCAILWRRRRHVWRLQAVDKQHLLTHVDAPDHVRISY